MDLLIAAVVLEGLFCVALGVVCAFQRNDMERCRVTTEAFGDLCKRRHFAATNKLLELEKQSPQKLAAEVAELGEAVAKLNATHRRFAGRVDQRRAQAPQHDVDDDELAAMLELQAAKPSAPGGE